MKIHLQEIEAPDSPLCKSRVHIYTGLAVGSSKLRNAIKTWVERQKYNLPLRGQHNLGTEDSHREQRKRPTEDEQTIQNQMRKLVMGREGKFIK